jgi:hypothetical protein
MEVPKEQREAALNSYLSPAGVEIALTILTSRQLSPELRKQVTDDTLGGTLAAKRAWFEQGMTLDIRDLVGNINVPTTVVCRRCRQGGERTWAATRARELQAEPNSSSCRASVICLLWKRRANLRPP